MNHCNRFAFGRDMNHDGLFTISDVVLNVKQVLLLPSKGVISILDDNQKLATFFEIGCSTGEGWGGAIFSALVWFVALLILAAAADAK